MERRGYSSEAPPDPTRAAAARGVRAASYGAGSGGDDGAAAAPPPAGPDASFDANMVIILAALFFALLFAVGLNSLARCALRCGGRGAAGGHGGRSSSSVVVGGGGIKRRALRSIPVEVYGHGAEEGEGEEDVCAICLGEFAGGEKVRVLPRCGHGFHVPCVDAWLLSRGSCPTCRRPVMDDGKLSHAAKAAGGQSRRLPDSDAIAVVIA